MKNEKIIDYTLNLLTKNKDDGVEYYDGYSRIGCIDINIGEALHILTALGSENLDIEQREVDPDTDPAGYEGSILLADLDITEGIKLVIIVKDIKFNNKFSVKDVIDTFLQSYLLVTDEELVLNDGTKLFDDEDQEVTDDDFYNFNRNRINNFFVDKNDDYHTINVPKSEINFTPEQWANLLVSEDYVFSKIDPCSIPEPFEPFDDGYDYPELEAILRLNAIASALNLDFNKEGERKINVKKYHIVKEIKQLEDYDKFVSLNVNNSILGRTVYRSDNEIAELLIRGYFDKHSEEAVKTFDKDLFKKAGKNITIEKAFRTEDRLFVLTKEGKKRYNALLDCTEYFNNERYTLLVDFIDRIREDDKDLYNAIK